jgi:hypothetical protein
MKGPNCRSLAALGMTSRNCDSGTQQLWFRSSGEDRSVLLADDRQPKADGQVWTGPLK